MGRPQRQRQRLTTRALLLRSVPVREADLIVTFFTEAAGCVAAVARGGRKSRRRFATLEPLHLLRIAIDQVAGRDLATLVEATVERPRVGLVAALAPLQAAGRALRWLRAAAPAREPDPAMWSEINALLDRLDTMPGDEGVDGPLAAGGLRLLAAAGWAIELQRCVRCDRRCPARARVRVDVEAGGVVCRACGGRGIGLSAAERLALVAAQMGDAARLGAPGHARVALELVERALRIHTGAELR